jgi:hypothetical protein
MLTRKLLIVYLIIILIISPVLTLSVYSHDESIPTWNKEWSYNQKITLPISTEDSFSIYQPIDLHINYENPCWAKNEKEHSVRICCWDGNKWYELESQIYNLKYTDQDHISSSGLVFLVPNIANGKEQYYIYYDKNEKPAPNYIDHVSVEDSYYFYEPISGVSLEGDYYRILEDGFGIYVIGQKGKIINRQLSQAVMKMKPQTKDFDVSNSDKIATFSFIYNIGNKEEDQVSSDQVLVSKNILIDGNLMVEFGIVSESSGKDLRSTNIYRYYYSPTEKKRISVHVKHEVFKEGLVKGQVNVDGAFGGLLEYQSKSMTIKRMRFGEILPFLHFFGENNKIKEYKMDTNPESRQREWIIPYNDDCDLGEDAWISFDEGEDGKVFAIIFSSNKDIVKYGKNERDGIQIKAVEKEYLDVLGAEIDYAGVMFGRNSYERGGEHDLTIAGDMSIEYDAELYNSDEGGYSDVIKEAEYYKELVKFRDKEENGLDNGEEDIYTLTVVPQISANIFYYPIIANITGFSLTDIWGELYQDNEFVSSSPMIKTLFGQPVIKFPKLSAGKYIVKVYRKILNFDKKVIGLISVNVNEDKTVNIYCTWEKKIQIDVIDQNNKKIKDVQLSLFKNNKLFFKEFTDGINKTILKVNFNFINPYVVCAYYKGFNITRIELPKFKKNVDIKFDIYDLDVNIRDKLGFNPGVNVRPYLTSSEMENQIEITPNENNKGEYKFKNLPSAVYRLHISYGRFSDEILIDIPNDDDSTNIEFSALYDLKTQLLDNRGDSIKNTNMKLNVKRKGITLYKNISPDKKLTLPPGKYHIDVYSDGKQVGKKTIDLTNNKEINIVTKIRSILPILITGIMLVFIIEISVIFLLKRFTLNTFLKLLAISLVILSLFQPWWSLEASSNNPISEKTSKMYILPQAMVESIEYKGQTNLELATVPEMFTDFVATLLIIIYGGLILLSLSFIPNILLKRRYFVLLISASIIFLTLVAFAFSFGMSKISEISLGSLNGSGTVDVVLPNGESVFMSSSWGLDIGFYLCIFSSIILIATGFIDLIRKKNLFEKILRKKK